jgi:capsular exopolysaccharide synthesis family protein
VYRATAQIVIDLRTPNIVDKVTQVYDLRDASNDTEQFIQTQIREMSSKDMADRVALTMGVPRGTLDGRLSVEPDRRAMVLYLSVTDGDPARAAIIANAFARAYERHSTEKRKGINKDAMAFLEAEAKKMRERLESAERALYRFHQHNKLPGANFEDSHRILSSNLVTTNGRLSDLQARKIRLESQLAEFDEGKKASADAGGAPPLPATIPVEEASERWGMLYKEYTTSRQNLDSLRSRYGDRHPKLREATIAATAIERDMRVQLVQLRTDLESRLRAIGKEERALLGSSSKETGRAVSLRQLEVENNRLMREVTGDRDAYDLVARRLRETQLTSMLVDGFAKVLEEASEVSAPISPRIAMTLWSALLLGLGLGIVLTFLLDFIDDSVRSPQDIEEVLGLPLLGTLPSVLPAATRRKHGRAPAEVELARAEYISRNPRSAAAEHGHAISTNLYSVFLKNPPRSIAVVGASPEEGKSFVAASVASTVASRGRKVLLVDCDLRRGRLHSTFGVPRADGIYEILTAEVSLDKAIRQTGIPNVDVLPTGMVPEKINPIRLLELPDFQRLVQQLEERYDLVVFDTPPLSLVSDVQIIGPLCDGALVVARYGRSTRRSMRSLVNQLRKAHCEVAGVVINDVDTNSSQYQYYYRNYGYSYQYGYGSEEAGRT